MYLDTDPFWLLQDATFEKMGAMMADNSGRLLALFDELSAFLTKVNLYKGRDASQILMIWLSFLSYTIQTLGREPQVIVVLRQYNGIIPN